jgi:hypothetical protein
MGGCSNNGWNSQCIIILIIVIFANQGLLDGSSRSRNALTLLFLYWLCCGFNNGCGNYNYGQMYGNQCSCGCQCCCISKCKEKKCKEKKRKEKKCKCRRIKICCA